MWHRIGTGSGAAMNPRVPKSAGNLASCGTVGF
jgi:hypothetical protein